MKRTYILLVVGMLLCSTMSAQQQRQVVILHTNDTHSCIDPIDPDDPRRETAGSAGVLRRVAFMQQMREQHPGALLFDCGDFSQGSPYYNFFRGDTEIGMMNEMHYDAGIIGNHEFDFGMDNMARIFRKAKFPILCANLGMAGTPLEHVVKPYVVLKRNGLRIGVFGLTALLEGLVEGKNCKGLEYLDPIQVAQQVATMLKTKKKCDLVICLSHLGWSEDQKLLAATRHIDVLLGGHSHTYFKETAYVANLDGVKVPVQQMGKNGSYVGQLNVTMKKVRK